jgi:hypothetical protein
MVNFDPGVELDPGRWFRSRRLRLDLEGGASAAAALGRRRQQEAAEHRRRRVEFGLRSTVWGAEGSYGSGATMRTRRSGSRRRERGRGGRRRRAEAAGNQGRRRLELEREEGQRGAREHGYLLEKLLERLNRPERRRIVGSAAAQISGGGGSCGGRAELVWGGSGADSRGREVGRRRRGLSRADEESPGGLGGVPWPSRTPWPGSSRPRLEEGDG